MLEELGDLLFSYRGRRTVVQVAEETGISRTMIGRYESGQVAIPFDKLVLLLKTYGRTWHDVADVLSGPRDPLADFVEETRARVASDPAQIEMARRLGVLEELFRTHLVRDPDKQKAENS